MQSRRVGQHIIGPVVKLLEHAHTVNNQITLGHQEASRKDLKARTPCEQAYKRETVSPGLKIKSAVKHGRHLHSMNT